MENGKYQGSALAGDHTNQWGRKTFEKCTKFIESSKAVLDYYQAKKTFPGQQKHIHKINSWLEEEDNKPLVFKTQPGCGIKTILSQWEKGIRQNNHLRKEKLLTIMHFASAGSNDSNYFYSLYQLIIKLKESLKLKQNVDLLEENIRKFFSYWLDIASSEVQKQKIIYCAEQIFHKVVIVIEAVDKFTDNQTGKEANIAFWLPQIFPKNVKVIVTARRHSESLHYLQRIGCQVIDVRSDVGIAEQIHADIIKKSNCLTYEASQRFKNALLDLSHKIYKSNNVYSFLEFYGGVFLPKNASHQWTQILEKRINIKQVEELNNILNLFNFVIQNSTDNPSVKAKFQSILLFLAISQKGLTQRQILLLSKINDNEWCHFFGIFNKVIVQYGQVYSIKARWLVESIVQREKQKKKDSFQQNLINYHERIARALQSTENSIRKLQQQAYHLFCAKSYFRLKEMVSNIQNFLLLFNPHNKYELSRYWQTLEEKGFDPVIEYNKAVEGFSMHYHPSDQNIFRIIVQISKFLKQFCDFETYDTPSFRHPYIQGNMLELRKIGLLTELTNLEIYIDNSFNPPQSGQYKQLSVEQQIKELKQKYFPKDCEKINQNVVVQGEKAVADQQLNYFKLIKKNESPKILSQIEQLNVDVPMNRDKFRQFYLKNLKQSMKKEDDGFSSNKAEGQYLDVDEPYISNKNSNHYLNTLSFQKIKDNYRLKDVKPSLYYYKRWIWIQFPWACISMNNNYSTTPQLRKKIEGEDNDNVDMQYKFTKHSLLVAIEARQKKKQMFSKKDPNIIQTPKITNNKSKGNLFTITKFNNSKGFLTAKIKTIPQFDLSLQSLSKQLQIRQKSKCILSTMQKQDKLLHEIYQNCEQQMKFITLRKQFEAPLVCGGEANQILPRVKWAIKEHTNYELEYIKNHIQQKKKKLNKIIYENKRLSDIYQQLRIKQALSKKNLHEQQQQKSGKKSKVLEDLLKKKEEVINQFCKSLLQKQRLKIILKLCSQNKTRNQQYLASLNYFLQNLKKMINTEKQSMKFIIQQLQFRKALTEKQSSLLHEKDQNRKVVQVEAQKYIQEKAKLQEQIENIKQTIWDDIQDHKDKMEHSLTGNIKHREEKNQIKQQEKTIKQLEERYEKANRDYAQLKNLFDLQDSKQLSQKMKNMLEQNQRNKQLKIIYFQKRNKLQELQRELSKVKEENQKQIQRELKKLSKVKNEKKQKHGKEVMGDHRIQIFLDNLCLKLGVSNKKDLLSTIQGKLKKVQTISN